MIKGTKETLPDIIAAIYAAIDKIANKAHFSHFLCGWYIHTN